MRVSRVARCLTERDLQGLGPLAALKSEGSIVFAGSIGLTVAGLVVGQLWFMSSALLTGLFLAKPSPPPPPPRPFFARTLWAGAHVLLCVCVMRIAVVSARVAVVQLRHQGVRQG